MGAVVGQNPDGTPKMADAKSTPFSELVKFTKGQPPLEAFMSNFIRQAKNPTLFSFFKLQEENYKLVGPVMADLIQNPGDNADMLKPYEVEVKATGQSASQAQEQTPEQKPEQTPATSAKTEPIDPNKIDWGKIEQQWGIKRDDLEKSGALDQMVYNHKSPQLFTVTPQFGDEKFSLQAKLSFRSNPDGSYSLVPHFIRSEPQLDQEFKGYTFTKEDKAELRKTGNLGKVVELADPKTGELQKSLVSIDKLTNEIEAIPVNKIYIKPKVANIDLDMKAIGVLKNGGLIREQHIELPNGAKFTADLQYSASKRDIVFVNSDLYRHNQAQSQGREDNSRHATRGTTRTAHLSVLNAGARYLSTSSNRQTTLPERKCSWAKGRTSSAMTAQSTSSTIPKRDSLRPSGYIPTATRSWASPRRARPRWPSTTTARPTRLPRMSRSLYREGRQSPKTITSSRSRGNRKVPKSERCRHH